MDSISGSREWRKSAATVAASSYPLRPAYSGASSSVTPNPGCQRRSAAGRWE